ncbi:MAG TPA: glycosyltransferase [Candidatus Cloacimonadota bacterium]|nr:glycosyltransferase [Candidatus Cloacimonadota bacterium]
MRILYISYFYPPLGGPAALRNTAVVKHLRASGWEIDVLTVRDPEYNYHDESLEDMASSVIRVPSLDPMSILKKLRFNKAKSAGTLYRQTPESLKLKLRRLFPLDDKSPWLPFLIRSAKQLMAKQKYDLIYVSCGPFSSGLAAWKLSRSSGIPYVYDARDYWTLLSDYQLQGWSRQLSRSWEARILKAAALVVTATDGIREDLADGFGAYLPDKSLTVFNGWDEDEFQGLEASEPEDFILSYYGNIYARRSLSAFYAAVSKLQRENALPPNTRIRLYGSFNREVLQEIASSGIQALIELIEQLPHREALQSMLNSSVLLLVINSSSPRGTLTSKVFEYLRTRKPILAMVPAHKEAAKLLNSCNHDYLCAMESVDGIAQTLRRLISERGIKKDYLCPVELSRKAQISRLEARLSELVHQPKK